MAEVVWRETRGKNIYRAGHKGLVSLQIVAQKDAASLVHISKTFCVQVDLKCKELGSGGYYYPEHLPVLGE